MPQKDFTTVRRPPTADQISAFERGGIGQDTRTHIPANVERREPAKVAKIEETRRLSIDLPKSLHVRFKAACAATDRKMIDEVMAFIERRTAELEAQRAT